ncbi:TonB-dependent receptor family protein [Brevundimonas diminuta]|nr:TonB-dependent receptor [Brevundimonas diminuta]
MPFPFLAAPCALLAATSADLPCPPTSVSSDPAVISTPLETVLVTGRRDPDNPQVVARARRSLWRTPGAVAVVAEESYRDRSAGSLADILPSVPGVLAQKRYGEENRLSIRGSGLGQGYHARGILLAQDGIPYNEADGFSDFQGLDPASARMVEVHKGANALPFGSTQLGGAINLVTPTGATAPFADFHQVEAGQGAMVRTQVRMARQAGPADVFVAASAMESQGWRAHSDQTAARLLVNAGHTADDWILRLIAQWVDVQQSLPAMLPLAHALATPRFTPPSNIANDFSQDQTIGRLSLQGGWRVSETMSVTAALWVSDRSLWHPIFQIIEQDSRNHGGFGQVEWSGRVGAMKADGVAGLSWRQGDRDALRFVNAGGQRGTQTGLSRQSAAGVDLFGEGRLFVAPDIALVAGGAVGRTSRQHRNALRSGSDRVEWSWFAPRIGVLWEPDPRMQMFANLSHSVEPPTYAALVQGARDDFVPVRIQTAWTAEIGSRGRMGDLAWDVAAYRSEMDGEMLNFQVGPDIPASTFNAGRTIHQGLEAGLDWRVPGGFAGGDMVIRQVYSWSDFRFSGDPLWGDNRLPVQPEHLYRAEIVWRGLRGLTVSPSINWRITAPFVDYANTLKAPAWALLNLGVAWRVNARLSVFADARNLTDERHVAEFAAVTDARTASTAVFYPGEGRSVHVGIRLVR